MYYSLRVLDLEDRKTAMGKTGKGGGGGAAGSWQLKRLGCAWKSECTQRLKQVKRGADLLLQAVLNPHTVSRLTFLDFARSLRCS